MTLKDDMALLAQIPVFNELESDHLRLLAFGAERRRLGAGEILFRQGDPADCAFVLTRGKLQLSPLLGGDKSEDKGWIGPPAMLSELAMLMAVERRMTATAVDNVEVLRITRALFHRMIEEYPLVGKTIEARLREKFSTAVGSLQDLASRFQP